VQPIWVQDFTTALFTALTDPHTAGKIYEIGGPKIYRMDELIDFVSNCTEYPVNKKYYSKQTAKLLAKYIWERSLFTPISTRDKIEFESINNVVSPSAKKKLKI